MTSAVDPEHAPGSAWRQTAAFVRPWIAGALYTAVVMMWLISDLRIERIVAAEAGQSRVPARRPAQPPTAGSRADRAVPSTSSDCRMEHHDERS